jgi:hypothetical protein
MKPIGVLLAWGMVAAFVSAVNAAAPVPLTYNAITDATARTEPPHVLDTVPSKVDDRPTAAPLAVRHSVEAHRCTTLAPLWPYHVAIAALAVHLARARAAK